jgi:hypothetical protein
MNFQDMGFLREAYDLENATLRRFEGFWKASRLSPLREALRR